MIRVAAHSGRTDTGRQRRVNEDSMLSHAPLFVVADGMGGAQAGEVASQAAVSAFEEGLPEGPLTETLPARIQTANRVIHDQARSDPAFAGMGTTITAAALDPASDTVTIGHVGDSRAYRIRGGIIQRLTRDHSLVEEMRRRGQLTEAQAEEHPQRSIITRALGPEAGVDVDVQEVAAAPGDLFLLCSDGLTSMLDDDRIRRIVVEADTLDQAARELVDAANMAGGRDNITVVLFQVEDPAAPLSRPGSPRVRPTTTAATREGRRRRRGLKVAASLFLSLLAVGLILGGAWLGSRQVWFVGTDEAGRVALYQGLPYEGPFGWELYRLEYPTAIQTGDLSAGRQQVVTDHRLRSRDDAVDLIREIETGRGS
ncbi:MAG: Stp1/IreP family PP2C-type Ser/Thr phosphatase [Solirubrobacterales bacterium]|jgi:serine/threonine protein phosphatase PrpC